MAAKPAKSNTRAARSASAPGLSIVVPVFNEAKGLVALHERIADVARRLKRKHGLATEVIYVDDGSTDSTNQIAHSLTAEPLDIQVVTLSRNFGKEAALLAGLDHARLGACCSWMATASIRPIWSIRWWRAGSMTVTTWSTPPRRTARTSRGCAVPACIGSTRWSTWARVRRFPRMPATSDCCRRARRTRCGRCPSATASSRASQAGSGSVRRASTTNRRRARMARPLGMSGRWSACRSKV